MVDLQKQLDGLIISDDPGKIEKTAAVLEGMGYRPTLLSDFPDFLRSGSARFFQELEGLLASPLPEGEDPEGFRERQASLLIYHYKLLNRLRRGEPEAWGEVNGLMDDD